MHLKGIFVLGLTLLLFIGTIASVFLSCKHDPQGLDKLDTICFETQILPIFQTSCALPKCHDAPGEESSFILTDYTHIMEAIKPGDPMKSPAYSSLIALYGENLMPPSQPLSEQNRNMIRVWILQGATNTNCTGTLTCDTTSVMTYIGNVLPVIELYCLACHSGASPQGGLLLDDYCKVAFQAHSGHLTGVLRDGTFPLMPPSAPIPECQIRQVELWVAGSSDTLCAPKPDTNTYSNPRACFKRDILPILQSSCAMTGCHNGTSGEIDFVFTSYASTMQAVVPGNPNQSSLYQAIKGGSENPMPPAPYPALTTAAKDSIYKWISYGAKDEYCGQACDTTTTPTFSGTIWPIIELNCRGCHSGGTPSGNVLLNNYTDVAAQAANGKLTGVLRDGTYFLMPPGGALSGCQIRQVEIWVKAGYPNNK